MTAPSTLSRVLYY